MKKHSELANMLTALGIELIIVILVMIWAADYVPSAVLKQPEEARIRVQTMFDAISCGNYERASNQMLGSPAFGSLPEDTTPAVELLWEAFAASLECRIPEKCYATDTGLALDVQVRCLDIASIVEGVNLRTQQLLAQGMDQMDAVLMEAARSALYEQAQYQDRTITISFTNAEGSWWILPDEELLNLLSGLPG